MLLFCGTNPIKLTDSYENDIDPDNVNFQVLWPSTAAQYFHLLRRQMVRNFRKPGAVVMPKTLLRFSGSLSTLEEMTPGTCYEPVIDDTAKSAKKVIVTCGRHFFTLLDERKKRKMEKDVALIRLEQLVPFPAKEIQGIFVIFFATFAFFRPGSFPHEIPQGSTKGNHFSYPKVPKIQDKKSEMCVSENLVSEISFKVNRQEPNKRSAICAPVSVRRARDL